MPRLNRSLFGFLVVGAALSGCEKDEATIVVQRPPLEADAAAQAPPPGETNPNQRDGGAVPTPGSVSEGGPGQSNGNGNGTNDDDGNDDNGNGNGNGNGNDDVTDTRLLPDLALDTAYLIETTTQDFIDVDDSCLISERCVTGLGTRRLVRFGTRTGNIGTADLLIGSPSRDNPLWSYDSCSEEFNLDGYAKYDVLAEPSGETVLLGAKNGFCMRDSEPWDESRTEEECAQYDCEHQGISVGCADNYVAGLKCQWVDITGISNGDYQIRVQINAERSVEELDYSNNTGFIPIRITSDDVIVLR
jgi:hypothetical protein